MDIHYIESQKVIIMDTMNKSCLEIMNSNNQTTVALLKSALASEYFAYHMYRSAYYKMRGIRRTSVIEEIKEHASEELEHANMIEERINILGGSTFNDPTEWDVWNTVDIPSIISTDVGVILDIINTSEQQAVDLYTDLYHKLSEDPVTQDMIVRILDKEQEHLFDVKYNMIGHTT